MDNSRKKWLLSELSDYAMIAFGVIIYSIGMTVFMLPYGLTTGGVVGIASIIYYATGIEIQVTYVLINILLLIAAIKVLGIRFCIKTIYAVFLMTFALWLMQRLIEVPDPNNDGQMILPRLIGDESFMACVLGAIICGSGLAVCFEHNGSTGGTDIIAAIVNKYRAMSLGSVLRICDVTIIASCYFIFHDWYRVIYGCVTLFVSSMTLDYWIQRHRQSVQFMIFSRNSEAIANAIINTGHGATMLKAEGWFTHSDRQVIISIIHRREQAMIQRMVKRIDPYAFVSLSDASEVWGEGFDIMKVSESKEQKAKRVLVYASNSVHKLSEARAIFGDKYEIRSLADIGCYIDIPEDADSLHGNALLKARFVKMYFGFDCIADDTALECVALNGLPGIYSRNYAAVDENAPNVATRKVTYEWNDEISNEMLNILHSHKPIVDKPTDHDVKANIGKLLSKMQGQTNRSARLHTVMVLLTGNYEDHNKWQTQVFDGILEGTIAEHATNHVENTFSYDSVFVPNGYSQTIAELGVDVKNQISSRAIVIRKLKTDLEQTH